MGSKAAAKRAAGPRRGEIDRAPYQFANGLQGKKVSIQVNEKKPPVLRTILMSYGMVAAVTIISIVGPILLGRKQDEKKK